MRISELMLMLEEDETISFQKEEYGNLIKIDKHDLENKKVWSIRQAFSNDQVKLMDAPDDIIWSNIKYMIEDIRNAHKR